MKETPRTDEQRADLVLGDDDLVYEAVRADFARELERELAAKAAEVERLRGALTGIHDRDFKLSDAKRRARRALLSMDALQEPQP